MIPTNSSDPNFDFYLSIIDNRGYWMCLAVFGFFFATVIITANSILLFTTYKDPRRLLRSPPSLLIANLSASNLLLGLFNVSLVAVRDVYRYNQVQMPYLGSFNAVMYTVLTTTLFVSSNSMISLSVTCYVAIGRPSKYKSIITKRRIKIYIAVLWVVALGTCILPVTNVSEETYTMIYLHTHASLPAIFLTVIYVKVFRAVARRTRELQLDGYNSMATNALERERNMAIAIIIILGLFYITYIPQYITLHLLYFCKPCQESLTFHEIDVALSRFLYINSAINPIIYVWKVPKYRQAFIDCWKISRGKLRGTYERSISLSNLSVPGRFLKNRNRVQSQLSESTNPEI